jgi:hypothetical protein
MIEVSGFLSVWWIRIQEAQNHTDPTYPDTDSDLDPQHWFKPLHSGPVENIILKTYHMYLI